MKIKTNGLMKSYLIDFDLFEEIEINGHPNLEIMKSALPEKLVELLDLPVLEDANGNYLINIRRNRKWVNEGRKVDDYSNNVDQTGFECDNNKINLWDYQPNMEEYMKDHELWAASFLKQGLYFSLLLFNKISAIEGRVLKVIFSYGLSKFVDSVICFHSLRFGESYIPEDFEKMPFVQGILTIDK
jgi:hypothetical protein